MTDVFYLTIIILILITCISLFVTKNKWEFLFYFFSFSLILTPSTKLLGLYSSSFFNYNINQFIVYVLIFYFLATSYKIFNKKNKVLTYYYKRYGVFFALILIAFLINMVFNAIYYGTSILILPRYHLMEYISFFVIIHFFLILFNKIKKERIKILFKNFWVILLIFSSVLSLLYSLKIPIATYLQGEAYNFNFLSAGSLVDNALEMSLYLNRSYSIFAGGNQFGVLAPLGLLVSSYFLREKLLTKTSFLLLIISQLIILGTSLSRTAILFYLFAILILIVRNSKNIFKIFIAIFVVGLILNYSLSFLDQRIKMIFNLDFMINAFFSERLSHWMEFFTLVKSNPESIFLGQIKSYLLTNDIFFENGYLNLYAEGGIITLFSFFLAYFVLIFKLGSSNNNNGHPEFLKLAREYLFLFLLIELLEGAFVAFRFESINAITIGYLIYMKYVMISTKYQTKVEISSL